MKNKFIKIISAILVVATLISVSSLTVFADTIDTDYSFSGPSTEMRGVWISFLEMQTMLQNKTEAQFTGNIATAMKNIKDYGLNTVFVQVRPYSDALYKSDYFPWSHIITGTEGKNPGFDPLEIMVREAKSQGLRIEAWINPYRIRPTGNTKPLASNSHASKWLKEGDRAVVQYGSLISYNPASTKAQNLIVNGVKEIVKNYDVDGIHIDDYFYPTTGTKFDKEFDIPEYNAYVEKGGKMSHGDWRRANVSLLIKKMYSAIKEENPKAVFGISPQSSITNNYNQQYFDVKKVVTNPGYCDYIMPQIYFGFDNKTQPFAETLDQWSQLITQSGVDLYVGLATYKIGSVDSYAGNGKHEWYLNTDRMASMVEYSRTKNNYGGFALYRYDHLFRPETKVASKVSSERANLKKVMQNY